MNSLKTLIVTIALSLSATAAYAEDDMGRDDFMNSANPQKRINKILKRFDTNNDKQITLEEARAVKQARFKKFDANQDGRLTMEEWQQGKEKLRAQRIQKRFAKRDANQDGIISLQEWQAKPSRNPRRQAMRFAQIDVNRDGHVSKQEFTAFANNRRMRRGQSMGQQTQATMPPGQRRGQNRGGFMRMDQNRDNTLSVQEFSHHVPLFKRFDRNRDQILTLDELGQPRHPSMGRGTGGAPR